MTTVMAFGTFDLFHKGHQSYLEQAKRLGARLVVVIARDETVNLVKGFFPEQNENDRLDVVFNNAHVDHAVLGSVGDKFEIIATINPDIICLGYDQEHYTEKLAEKLAERNLFPEIIRASGYKPEIFKTSLIRLKKESSQLDQ